MDLNSDLSSTLNKTPDSVNQSNTSAKLITALTDLLPALFSPGGVLVKENEEKHKQDVL